MHKIWLASRVQHALDCMLGGFSSSTTRHETWLPSVFEDVAIEPPLQELSGEIFKYKSANKDADARSDNRCCGFWREKRQAYFDVKVVSPFAKSYSNLTPEQLFKQAEKAKEREYGERIREVEHADFTPLVFTCAGGIGPKAA